MREFFKEKKIVVSLLVLCVAEALLFTRMHPVGTTQAPSQPTYHALDVGQGDATLIELPNGIRVLTDAGVDQSVVSQVAEVLGDETYIDIGIITHPEKDHFYGFLPLLKRYRFGIILWSGRADAPDQKDWQAFVSALKAESIPMFAVRRGDVIHTQSAALSILSPGNEYAESAELNDTSVVTHVRTTGWSALITGDIDSPLEHDLVERFGEGLRADILKVPHHGSRYSSSDEFLAAVQPKVATISVGTRNTYGHPSPEALDRYAVHDVHVFRTDQDEAVELFLNEEGLAVSTSSRP